jgi:hypothetical protein
MEKAQIYLVTFILITISLLGILLVWQKQEINPELSEFNTIYETIHARNQWLSENWYDPRWYNKLVINITDGDLNPAAINFNPQGVNCTKEIVVVNKTSSGFNRITPVNVNQSSVPCRIFFNASRGVYEIYYNTTENANNGIITDPGSVTNAEQYGPYSGPALCDIFEKMLQKNGIYLSCSVQPNIIIKGYNWTIEYKTPKFYFNGTLA